MSSEFLSELFAQRNDVRMRQETTVAIPPRAPPPSTSRFSLDASVSARAAQDAAPGEPVNENKDETDVTGEQGEDDKAKQLQQLLDKLPTYGSIMMRGSPENWSTCPNASILMRAAHEAPITTSFQVSPTGRSWW